MAQRPERDEPLQLDLSAGVKGKRVYLKDLAKHLGHKVRDLRIFANNLGVLYWQSVGSGYDPVAYVSEQAAMRVIAHIRAIQGAEYTIGKDYHAIRAAIAASMRASKARRLANLKQEREAQAARESLLLAIPRADTEDEPERG